MRRLAGILFALWLLTVGTGAAEHLHNLQHDRDDAAAEVIAQTNGQPVQDHPVHDESNCFTHAALHAPALSTGWVPILIALGLIVAFLSQIAEAPRSQCRLFSVDCRGPPRCA